MAGRPFQSRPWRKDTGCVRGSVHSLHSLWSSLQNDLQDSAASRQGLHPTSSPELGPPSSPRKTPGIPVVVLCVSRLLLPEFSEMEDHLVFWFWLLRFQYLSCYGPFKLLQCALDNVSFSINCTSSGPDMVLHGSTVIHPHIAPQRRTCVTPFTGGETSMEEEVFVWCSTVSKW